MLSAGRQEPTVNRIRIPNRKVPAAKISKHAEAGCRRPCQNLSPPCQVCKSRSWQNLVSRQISRDCEPSPATTLQWSNHTFVFTTRRHKPLQHAARHGPSTTAFSTDLPASRTGILASCLPSCHCPPQGLLTAAGGGRQRSWQWRVVGGSVTEIHNVSR